MSEKSFTSTFSIMKLIKRLVLVAIFLLFTFMIMDWMWPLPMEEFEQRNFAQVVVDKSGNPLRAFADDNGVWRYPVTLSDVSPRYVEALLNYEDRYFYQHFGINPLALFRAIGQRIKHGRFVSGASTLTMQVARIMKPHEKSMTGKLSQMFRALQLEWHYSKDEILTFYLNYAPFGGTIEGVQAASFTYLGKSADQLSYSEAALLAVLPQAPSRYRPDRYPMKAKQARDKVLNRLLVDEVWNPTVVAEAKQENVWASFNSRPMIAPLLSQRLSRQFPDQRVVHSTVDIQLQSELEWMLKEHIRQKDDQVSAAIVVIDNQDMSTLAYLGSADYLSESRKGYVDMIRAVRSPGSTLKPFIYGMAIDQGLIHSQSLLFDVPHSFSGYRPRNFTDEFSGPVSVAQALTRSLNMPAVQVLEQLTPESFYVKLKNAGLDLSLPKNAVPNLSLALGGGGVSMEQLVGAFASLGRGGQAGKIRLSQGDSVNSYPLLSEGSAWIVQNMLSQASLNNHLKQSQLIKKPGIAFKTGTSYGFRDAWVLTSNKRVTIGVWVGQPDGSYLEENSGRNSAVPLLNQILAILPENYHESIEQPYTVGAQTICWPLGYQINAQDSSSCHQKKNAYLLEEVAPPTLSDPMSKLFSADQLSVLIDKKTGRQVTPECALGTTEIRKIAVWPMVLENWLPHEFRRRKLLPAFSPDCQLLVSQNKLEIIGIHDNAVLYPEVSSADIPDIKLSLAGSKGQNYWFLNGKLLKQYGSNVSLKNLSPGSYQLQVIDSSANQTSINFSVQI